jgi:hypothetical protein
VPLRRPCYRGLATLLGLVPERGDVFLHLSGAAGPCPDSRAAPFFSVRPLCRPARRGMLPLPRSDPPAVRIEQTSGGPRINWPPSLRQPDWRLSQRLAFRVTIMCLATAGVRGAGAVSCCCRAVGFPRCGVIHGTCRLAFPASAGRHPPAVSQLTLRLSVSAFEAPPLRCAITHQPWWPAARCGTQARTDRLLIVAKRQPDH